MDPFAETRTVVMIGDIIDPITRQHYDRDPRWIARKAELHLRNTTVWPTRRISAPKPSSLSSTTFVLIRLQTAGSIL